MTTRLTRPALAAMAFVLPSAAALAVAIASCTAATGGPGARPAASGADGTAAGRAAGPVLDADPRAGPSRGFSRQRARAGHRPATRALRRRGNDHGQWRPAGQYLTGWTRDFIAVLADLPAVPAPGIHAVP
jgi:hypothetical protein